MLDLIFKNAPLILSRPSPTSTMQNQGTSKMIEKGWRVYQYHSYLTNGQNTKQNSHTKKNGKVLLGLILNSFQY
jgi:hypothetical protein